MNPLQNPPMQQEPDPLDAYRNDLKHYLAEAEQNFADFLLIANKLPENARTGLFDKEAHEETNSILRSIDTLKRAIKGM